VSRARTLRRLVVAALLVAPLPARAEPPDFQPGQLWSLKAASPIRVIIGKVEPWRDTVAVHVSLIDVPIPPGLPDAGGVTAIDHVPFEQAALAGSLDRLLASDADPAEDFVVGYGLWLAAQGEVYRVDVLRAVELIFEALGPGGMPPRRRRAAR
jgi:hypothetical protein